MNAEITVLPGGPMSETGPQNKHAGPTVYVLLQMQYMKSVPSSWSGSNPERVSAGSMIHREHPEWLIKPENHTSYLFDFSNEEARSWMTNYICNFIEKEGIDYYRQDFNFDPAPYWDLTDKPNRIGITENKHIQGLYHFWDSLLERFPNLLIDNCAGGGRRIDLETISRSAPLWRTDYQYGEPIGKQCHTYALNFYIPIHGTGVSTQDNYNFHSGLSAAAQGAWLTGGYGRRQMK